MDEPKLIHKFEKNPLEQIWVTMSQYKKKDYFSIRLYYQVDGEGWRPTKKGITLSVDLVPDLLRAVEALRVAVDE
jgi:hypothetical protein